MGQASTGGFWNDWHAERLMAIVVQKASPLTYKRPGTPGTAAGTRLGTRLGLIDSVLNRLRPLWQSPSHARSVHGTMSLVASTPPRRDPPALSYPTLRSPPFPPFLSPPSPHNFTSILLSFFLNRPGSISRLSGASQRGLPSSAAALISARAYCCGPE